MGNWTHNSFKLCGSFVQHTKGADNYKIFSQNNLPSRGPIVVSKTRIITFIPLTSSIFCSASVCVEHTIFDLLKTLKQKRQLAFALNSANVPASTGYRIPAARGFQIRHFSFCPSHSKIRISGKSRCYQTVNLLASSTSYSTWVAYIPIVQWMETRNCISWLIKKKTKGWFVQVLDCPIVV